MSSQALKEKLLFVTEAEEATLPPENVLLLLTSTLATPVSFVIHHFLHELLNSPTNEGVVFVSFLNGRERLASSLKKFGCDLGQAQLQKRFIFVDGVLQLFTTKLASNTDSSPQITLVNHLPWASTLANTIVKALGDTKAQKPSLFIEGLDFILAAGGDSITANEILALLSSLFERASRAFISLFADHNLLESPQSKSNLAQNQTILLTSLIHRAHSVISLRPLQTGTAKDVTGVIRRTRGGSWYDFQRKDGNTGETDEWEMLYRVEDGRGKLFNHA